MKASIPTAAAAAAMARQLSLRLPAKQEQCEPAKTAKTASSMDAQNKQTWLSELS